MGAIADIKSAIKQQGGFRQTHFNQAARRYAEQGQTVPPGMRADSLAYARLASQYVHWTVEALAAVAAGAAREAAVTPLVDRLCQLAVEYFRRPMMLRVVRAANELTSPQFLTIDLAGAGELANELLGAFSTSLKAQAIKDVRPILAGAAVPITISSPARATEPFPDAAGRAALEKARAAGRLLPPKPIAQPPSVAPAPRPAAPMQSAATSSPAPAPDSSQDARLFGRWVYHDWVFPVPGYGGGSIRIDRHWLFGPDGRFAAVPSSVTSFRSRSGDVDRIAAAADLSAADRGQWQADGRQLVVRLDNGDVGVYAYEFQSGQLVTDPTLPRLRKKWQRE